MKGILGVYFVVKQEQGTKELVEMILLWLISLSVSHWGSSLLTRQGSETRVIRVLRHRVSQSVAVMVLVSVMGGYWVVV